MSDVGFKNEPEINFGDPKTARLERQTIADAYKMVRVNPVMSFGKKVPALIAGRAVFSAQTIARENPSNTKEKIADISVVSPKLVQDKVIPLIETSKQAREWKNATFAHRAEVLLKIADNLRKMRYRLIALCMLEVGKNAAEADAEICEAIDFCRYYAKCAKDMEQAQQSNLLQFAAEKNYGYLVPVGNPPICVSIQPWNFPVAISVGPAAAALVCGYAVLYKPAEESSVLGFHVAKAFYDAGVPKDVFHFLPGKGEELGAFLVQHPAVTTIAFTGSKEVAEKIEKAVFDFNHEGIKQLPPKNRFKKRIAALETGGKNAMIIDSDADLNEAVVDATAAAFGFCGQKCSALSRLIVVDPKGKHGKVYGKFIKTFAERVKSLQIGPPDNPANTMGPLISKEAHIKLARYANMARQQGTVVAEGKISEDVDYDENGYFAIPLVVEGLELDSPVVTDEIFGPVLAVFCVKTFDEAIELANNTQYALTAGVYSRNPRHKARAHRELDAGNIYINRRITGAVVARQPFGGRKMSGNGTKAGGHDYLLGFLERRHISENTLRQGTAIE